ncbi:MAG: hypothetical protein KAX78_08865, partial [Phycisphaerae bacterium]|nr:hypothetical protein [Phycisphaerae bacterium]
TARKYGAKGLAWCKLEGAAAAGGVAKFLPQQVQQQLTQQLSAGDGDLIFFVADQAPTVNRILAALRVKLGADLKLYGPDELAWCWVVQFPLVEWDEREGRYQSMHHPFTSPRAEDLAKLQTDPPSVKSRAYDIVCNGMELAGGSIRIHSPQVQQQVFKLLGICPPEARTKFGFLLDALKYGAPPHGGIAFGLDRIVMMMVGGQSIRDVIAFPKTQRGICPLTGAPAPIDEVQLADLSLRVSVHHPAQKDEPRS